MRLHVHCDRRSDVAEAGQATAVPTFALEVKCFVCKLFRCVAEVETRPARDPPRSNARTTGARSRPGVARSARVSSDAGSNHDVCSLRNLRTPFGCGDTTELRFPLIVFDGASLDGRRDLPARLPCQTAVAAHSRVEATMKLEERTINDVSLVTVTGDITISRGADMASFGDTRGA